MSGWAAHPDFLLLPKLLLILGPHGHSQDGPSSSRRVNPFPSGWRGASRTWPHVAVGRDTKEHNGVGSLPPSARAMVILGEGRGRGFTCVSTCPCESLLLAPGAPRGWWARPHGGGDQDAGQCHSSKPCPPTATSSAVKGSFGSLVSALSLTADQVSRAQPPRPQTCPRGRGRQAVRWAEGAGRGSPDLFLCPRRQPGRDGWQREAHFIPARRRGPRGPERCCPDPATGFWPQGSNSRRGVPVTP